MLVYEYKVDGNHKQYAASPENKSTLPIERKHEKLWRSSI